MIFLVSVNVAKKEVIFTGNILWENKNMHKDNSTASNPLLNEHFLNKRHHGDR